MHALDNATPSHVHPYYRATVRSLPRVFVMERPVLDTLTQNVVELSVSKEDRRHGTGFTDLATSTKVMIVSRTPRCRPSVTYWCLEGGHWSWTDRSVDRDYRALIAAVVGGGTGRPIGRLLLG